MKIKGRYPRVFFSGMELVFKDCFITENGKFYVRRKMLDRLYGENNQEVLHVA